VTGARQLRARKSGRRSLNRRKQRPLRKMGVKQGVFFIRNSGKPEGFGTFPEFMSSSFKNKRDA
jgi:hypothetical protein